MPGIARSWFDVWVDPGWSLRPGRRRVEAGVHVS